MDTEGTTIRISKKDKLKLQAFARALGKKSLGDAFGEIMKFIEARREEFLGRGEERKEEPMLSLLERSGRFAGTDARKVNRYLYGRGK